MIRAELTGSSTASACGLTARSRSPVLALCRQLVEADHDAEMPFEAYRGDVLCLKVHSIGEAQGLRSTPVDRVLHGRATCEQPRLFALRQSPTHGASAACLGRSTALLSKQNEERVA